MIRPTSGSGAKTAERAPTTTRTSPRDRRLAHRPALAVGDAGVQHRDQIAEARGEAAARSAARARSRARARAPSSAARERALGGAQVDLGLAGSGDAVEQEIAPARLEQRLDARHCGGLVGRQRLGPRRAPGLDRRHAQARIERDEAVGASLRTVAAVVPARSHELGQRQRAVGERRRAARGGARCRPRPPSPRPTCHAAAARAAAAPARAREPASSRSTTRSRGRARARRVRSAARPRRARRPRACPRAATARPPRRRRRARCAPPAARARRRPARARRPRAGGSRAARAARAS